MLTKKGKKFKINKPTGTLLKKYCDRLWSLLIKVRAGYKSEYSGKAEVLNAHHLRGKKSLALRYSLENGYCCTAGEHKFGFHSIANNHKYESRVKEQRGADIFKRLEAVNGNGKLWSYRAMLENELIGMGVTDYVDKITLTKKEKKLLGFI